MEKKYIKGLYLNTREKQPDFVIGQLSFKMDMIDELIKTLEEIKNDKGYAKIDILKGDKGPYLKPNTYYLDKIK